MHQKVHEGIDNVQFVPLNENDFENTSCGIGKWRPVFLQNFANAKSYLVIFCALGVLQGAYFNYTVGIVSTIEKRYAFDSKISGLILIADNLSPILTSLLIGYYGGQAHRPRIIAAGMMMVVLSCFISSLPYFIFGPGLHLLNKDIGTTNGTKYELCDVGDGLSSQERDCNELKQLSSTVPAVSLLFIGSFLNGFGSSAFYTAGVSYLDDNVKKKDSPVYFSTTMSIRLFGPSLGFLLASYCLRKFESPTMNPDITPQDPKWVGAWWLGFLILGVLLFIFTLPMIFFPRTLKEPSSKKGPPIKPKLKESNELPKLKDMPKSLLRLLRNGIFVAHTLAIIFHVNGMMGYYILMPRYMEAHFRRSASSASLISGSTGIVTMLIGIMIGGYVIRRYKPRPRYLTGYMVFLNIVGMTSILIIMFLACKPAEISAPSTSEGYDLINGCNDGCGCSTHVFQPICSSENVNYFSPCHAGCSGSVVQNDSKVHFTGCQCTSSDDKSLTSGFCPFYCNMFLPYILVLCIAKMISSTGRVGSTLINLRCVDRKDKTLALGAIGCVLSIFAFIPYPLVFGALADSTCMIWEEKCGQQGNCWLYDVDKLRYVMHGTCFALMGIGTIFDFIVFLLSDRLKNFYDDNDEDLTISEKKSNLPLDTKEDSKWRTDSDKDESVLFLKLPNLSATSVIKIDADI